MSKDLKNIEVIEPIIVTNYSHNMKDTLDLSKLSKEELKAEIRKREAEEKRQQKLAEVEYTKDRDSFITDTVVSFKQFQDQLQQTKKFSIDNALELRKRNYQLLGREPKDQKQFKIESSCGTKKVVVEQQERFSFTEKSQVAIDAIHDFFKKKFEDRNKSVWSLLDQVLKNRKGEYDPKLLTKLNFQVKKINDPELNKWFDELQDSLVVRATSQYFRAYEKDAQNKWKEISLNFSSL